MSHGYGEDSLDWSSDWSIIGSMCVCWPCCCPIWFFSNCDESNYTLAKYDYIHMRRKIDFAPCFLKYILCYSPQIVLVARLLCTCCVIVNQKDGDKKTALDGSRSRQRSCFTFMLLNCCCAEDNDNVS